MRLMAHFKGDAIAVVVKDAYARLARVGIPHNHHYPPCGVQQVLAGRHSVPRRMGMGDPEVGKVDGEHPPVE